MSSSQADFGSSYHEGLAPHEGDYVAGSMDEYTNEELRWWDRLLTKRAGMRTDEAKRDKDLYDAKNYRKALSARSRAIS